MLSLSIDLEQEEDGRWIAEVMQLPGVMVYGLTPEDAVRKAKSLALQVLAEQVASAELQQLDAITFISAA
jgi:predicted RNase H-like HicB family nuclease